MEHFYENISGWFSYDYIYKDIVEQVDNGALLVEIGSFKGKSTAYMAVEIANSGKNIQFDAIDPMELLGHYAVSAEEKPEEFEGYNAEDFLKRLDSVKNYFNLRQMTSEQATALYQDKSIDFIMIDGDHTYEGVANDIKNYLPKMKSGGIMAFDDAYDDTIKRAIQDTAGDLNPTFTGIHCFIEIP